MNISLNYKDKETTIKMPENYNELLTQFQNAYSLNESIMKKINMFYLDDDNEKNIISGDEDLSFFITSCNEGTIVKCIYCESIDKDDEKDLDKEDEINQLQIKIEALKLKNKEEIEQKDDEYNNKIKKEMESKDNIIKNELLKKENLLNEEIKNKENEFKRNIQDTILKKEKEINELKLKLKTENDQKLQEFLKKEEENKKKHEEINKKEE